MGDKDDIFKSNFGSDTPPGYDKINLNSSESFDKRRHHRPRRPQMPPGSLFQTSSDHDSKKHREVEDKKTGCFCCFKK